MPTAKTLALTLALVFAPLAAHAQLLIIGLDSKISFDKAGTVIFGPPGKDSVAIVDISSPEAPKIVANLPLMNTIIGPPTNLAITPDGKRALVVKFPGHRIGVLVVDGQKVTDTKHNMNVGLWPYNVDVTPDGAIALVADNGASGNSDGQVDTVSVIDIEATPPRVTDKVVVGDSPEGLTISPKGNLAATALNRGTNVAWNSWFYNRNGSVVILKIDGKKVTKLDEVEVRGLPQAIAWSADGKYLYVGNFIDGDMSILRVEETKKGIRVVNTGKNFKLPGNPASMRGRNQ